MVYVSKPWHGYWYLAEENKSMKKKVLRTAYLASQKDHSLFRLTKLKSFSFGVNKIWCQWGSATLLWKAITEKYIQVTGYLCILNILSFFVCVVFFWCVFFLGVWIFFAPTIFTRLTQKIKGIKRKGAVFPHNNQTTEKKTWQMSIKCLRDC